MQGVGKGYGKGKGKKGSDYQGVADIVAEVLRRQWEEGWVDG